MRVRAILFAIFLALAPLTGGSGIAHAQAASASSVDAALTEARTTMVSNPREGLALAVAAEKSARGMPEGRARTIAVATALWLQSEAYLRLNDAAKARPLIARALDMIGAINEPIKLRGDLLLSLGALQFDDGQASAALGSYQRAYQIFQKLGERRSQALALHYIATLYSAANDDARAERYFKQAAETYDGDPSLSLSLHNSRGNVLLTLERYDEAEAEYLKALEIARRLDDPMLEARVLGNLARDQVEAGRLDAAERTLARGFDLMRGAKAPGFRQQLLATAARVAMLRGDLGRARGLISEAFAGVDLTQTSSSYRDAHVIAYLIFKKTGDTQLALRHLEAVRRLKDEATKIATTTSAALMAARFDYANQELRIANLKAEELRRNVEYERSRAGWQRGIFLSLGGATLVVIALLSVGLVTIRRSRNEVRAANADLAATNTALEKALAAKTEFLATTSHEIRTPLNGILGMTQVMLADPALGAAMRDRIGVVHGAGLTMRALVDDILDVAKMETGNLTIEQAPMDLCATLNEVTRIWEEQARAKGLTFRLETDAAPQWIVGDAARLRQIVFNLLSNAIKFTARGGVVLRASTTGAGGDRRLRIDVADTGIGIPEAKREEIFESFRQVDASTTRRFGGTGLGLTICRNLARALGGDISVDGTEGQGSCFHIDLPLVEAEAPAAAAAKGPEPGGVLVLDRNPIARGMLKTLIEPHAGTPRFVATPAEALAALDEGGPVAVLVDEATVRAADGDDPVGALRPVVVRAVETGVRLVVLWNAKDSEGQAALAETGVTAIVGKPARGPAVIDALFGGEGENNAPKDGTTLVSRAA